MSILFTIMIFHGFAQQSFIWSNIIPLRIGSKVDISDSANYRSFTISSIISKILDNIIIQRQSVVLQTSNHQFRFKPKSSTVLCTSMITGTIEYYNEMGDKPECLLLLDARKAFNQVVYNVLFILSLGMSLCAKIVKLLLNTLNMYMHCSHVTLHGIVLGLKNLRFLTV